MAAPTANPLESLRHCPDCKSTPECRVICDNPMKVELRCPHLQAYGVPAVAAKLWNDAMKDAVKSRARAAGIKNGVKCRKCGQFLIGRWNHDQGYYLSCCGTHVFSSASLEEAAAHFAAAQHPRGGAKLVIGKVVVGPKMGHAMKFPGQSRDPGFWVHDWSGSGPQAGSPPSIWSSHSTDGRPVESSKTASAPAEDDAKKTRSYETPGDPANPNRCRDEALVRRVERAWKELEHVWNCIKQTEAAQLQSSKNLWENVRRLDRKFTALDDSISGVFTRLKDLELAAAAGILREAAATNNPPAPSVPEPAKCDPDECCRWNPDKQPFPEPVVGMLNELFRHRTNASLSMLEAEVNELRERVRELERADEPSQPVKDAETGKEPTESNHSVSLNSSPSPERLRKMADAEDAAGCGLLTTDREPEAKRQTYVEKFLAESKESSEAYRKAEIEYEADHFPDASKKVEPQPAGELREWLVDGTVYKDAWGVHYCRALVDPSQRDSRPYFSAREVPSPERVRQALDAFAIQGGYEDWSEYKTGIPGLSNRILAILRSLGINTEGV